MPPAAAAACPSSHPCARRVSPTARGEWSASGVTVTRRRVRPAACPEEVREPATRRASSECWPVRRRVEPAAGLRGGSGWFLTSRSRSSRSIVSRSSSASAIRSSSSRFSADDAAWRGRTPRRSGASPRRPPAARSARETSRRWANSRPRKSSCSLSPTAIGPIASLMPHWVTMRRASAVACWMSFAAPGRDLVGAEDELLGHAAAVGHRQAADRASPCCSCAGRPRAARR